MATASDTRTVVGVFNTVHDAQEAVRELESAGVSRNDISIVANKNAAGYETMDKRDRDKAADVVADAGIGAAIGGVGGLLLSAAGALTVPVIGPIIAAGPIAAALTGAGIGAAAGGLVGALTESGIPEEQAKYYAEGVRRGDVLVTVHAPRGREDDVADILDRNRAIDVDERVAGWKERGWSGYRDDVEPYTEEEYRKERSYYSGSSLTGEQGIGVERERSRLHSDRDDLTPPVGYTRESNEAGDIANSGTVSTTGLSAAGLGSKRRDRDADVAGPGDMSTPGGTSSGGAAGEPPRQGLWNTEARDTGYDSRSEHPAERNVGQWADETRGDFGSIDRRSSADRMDEIKTEAKEKWREDAERRRRSRIYDRTFI